MKNFKIAVHIPFYIKKPYNKKKLQNFKKVCSNLLKLSKDTKIFVHSNQRFLNKNKKITYLKYNFKDDHPFKLTWYCRSLMKSQKNNFDIFIYCEDDILFNKKNLHYWLKYKDSCINNNYNLGFLRYEINKKNKKYYSTDQIEPSSKYLNISKKKYLVLANSNCSFWIYDKKEFGDFIKTKFYNFNWRWISVSNILLIREMAAVGWHGENMNGISMGRYLATIIPFKKKKLDDGALIRHLSDNYANAPQGLFGRLKISQIPHSNLNKFLPLTIFDKLLKRTSYIIYHLLRFNLKSYFKNNTLHKDLRSGIIFK